MDKYSSFTELQQNESMGKDYTIIFREADGAIAIMAPHGGGIEPGTIDVADAIAGREYPLYAFKGLKKEGNSILHITSNRYDEPIGLQTSQKAWIVISIHGCRETKAVVFVGGKNQGLKQRIIAALNQAGFAAETSERPGLRGISNQNICNRCKCGEGVQLELSRGLREKMFDDLRRRALRQKTRIFYDFVTTIRAVLQNFQRRETNGLA